MYRVIQYKVSHFVDVYKRQVIMYYKHISEKLTYIRRASHERGDKLYTPEGCGTEKKYRLADYFNRWWDEYAQHPAEYITPEQYKACLLYTSRSSRTN